MSPVLDRMAEALRQLAAGPRRPKAFYLGPEDWADFIAGDPPRINALFNGKPCEQPGFQSVPVRPSKNVPPRQSRLYDHTGAGRMLPEIVTVPRA